MTLNSSYNPFVVEQLSNGLTVAIETMPHVQSVACGFLVRTGARDDSRQLAGVSHFLEHMMFKGTTRRSWEQVNIEFDEMGSYYNAYTSKDRTFYYGWVQTRDFDRQLELLADMMRSTLPSDQFDVEKNVVLEEIAMAKDDLASMAYDELHEKWYADSGMAWPILGYQESIEAMSRQQMADYFSRRYAPNNLILLVAGNVEPAAVMRSAERYCGHWERSADLGSTRERPRFSAGVATQVLDRFHQQAVLLAFPSVAVTDPLFETAEATAAILGGENSRFYWNVVQKGICARAGVFHEEYEDFGSLVMFGLCEPENCERLLDAMRAEAAELAANGPQEKELSRVKNLRRTSLANESEAPFYRLGQLADDLDYRGRPRPAADRLAAVDAVSASSVAEFLKRCPITSNSCLVSVGPRSWPT